MKFKFKLEVLLNQRKRVQEEAMSAFAEAQRELNKAMEELNKFYVLEEKSFSEIEKEQNKGGAAAASLWSIDEFLSGLKVRILQQKEVIREKQAVFEDKKNEFVLAAQEFKTLEKLKENKREEFKKYKKEKELKIADDNAIMSYKRREVA